MAKPLNPPIQDESPTGVNIDEELHKQSLSLDYADALVPDQFVEPIKASIHSDAIYQQTFNMGTENPFRTSRKGLVYLQEHYPGKGYDVRPRLYLPNIALPDQRNPGKTINLRLYQMREIHEYTLCHLGFQKTYRFLSEYFYWPSMRTEIEQYCKTCDTCQRTKRSTTKPAGQARQLHIPRGCWRSIAIDFQGPFQTKNGKKTIMNIMCRLSCALEMILLQRSSPLAMWQTTLLKNTFRDTENQMKSSPIETPDSRVTSGPKLPKLSESYAPWLLHSTRIRTDSWNA